MESANQMVTNKNERSIRDYFKIVLKRKWLVICIFLVVVISVTIYTLNQENIYRSVNTLMIDKEAPTIVQFQGKEVVSLGDETGGYRDYYQTQYKIIKSLNILQKVYKELRLKNDTYYNNNNTSKYPFQSFVNSIKVIPVLNTRLIRVAVDHNNPIKAALVANKVAEVYREENLARKLRATKEAVTFLDSEVVDFKKKVTGAENKLQRYKESHSLTELPTEGYLAQIRAMEIEENDLKTKLAELKKRYKEKHPTVVEAKTRLDSIQKRIKEETDETLKLHKTLIDYNVLSRETESNQQLLNNLIQRSKETNLSQSIKTNNIEVIEYAYPSIKPIKPRVRLNIALAMVIGLIGGVGMAFLLDALDNTLKSPEDIEQHLQLPFLGFIPSVQRKDAKKVADIDTIAHVAPKSTVSEAYRAVRTAIMFSTPGEPAKVLTVTSSNPREGKTTSAINIAIAMANAGDKVLIIDADMRKPRIHKTFSVDNTTGLSNLIVGNTDIENVIHKTEVPNLSVISSGPIPPNPSELLHPKNMVEILNTLKDNYDRIVFDSPPISAVTDSVILGALSDGVIMVIHCGKTPREACLFAKQKITDARGRILGVILNNVALHKDAYYYYYYYRYNYSYYGHDGKTKKRVSSNTQNNKVAAKEKEEIPV